MGMYFNSSGTDVQGVLQRQTLTLYACGRVVGALGPSDPIIDLALSSFGGQHHSQVYT
jgi:hypothetical protein